MRNQYVLRGRTMVMRQGNVTYPSGWTRNQHNGGQLPASLSHRQHARRQPFGASGGGAHGIGVRLASLTVAAAMTAFALWLVWVAVALAVTA